jgi:hypothetical protein
MTTNSNIKTRKFKALHPCRKARIRQEGRSTIKRHTHNTVAGLEDLTAVILDVTFTLRRLETFLNAIQGDLQKTKDRVDTALDTVNLIRIGPHAYPTNAKPKRIKANGSKKTQN